MSTITTKPNVRTSRVKPQSVVPSTDALLRGNRYGELLSSVLPPRHQLADEGSYFTSTNITTPGTGIALNAVQTAFSDTVGFVVIKNTASPSDPEARRVYLDYLRLILTAAPTATVALHFALKRSTISREPTTAANRQILSPVNMSSAAGEASVARVLSYTAAGAMTIPASTGDDPIIARATLPTSLGIVGDEYLLRFGGDDNAGVAGLTAVRASAPARIVGILPPVVIEPGEWLVIHRWWTAEATTPPSYELELGHYER